MTMKKQMESKATVVIAGGDQSNMFLPGFRYSLGDATYKVLKKAYADNTEMREIVDDRGNIEIMTVESMIRDFDPDRNPAGVAKILEPDKNYQNKLNK